MGAFTVYAIKKEFLHVERYEILDNGIREYPNSIFNKGVSTKDNPKLHSYLKDKKEEFKLLNKSQSKFPIYYRDSYSDNPWWRTFWQIPEELYNRSIDILVILDINKTLFAIVHGHARYFINPLSIIYDFGLRSALNLVDERKLNSAETFIPSEIGMRTKKQPGKMTSIENYDINILNTLLKQVGGIVKEEFSEYFKTIEGADSVRFNYKGNSDELSNVLINLRESYNKKEYIDKGFAWIDNFRPIRDKNLIEQLNKILVERMLSGSDDVNLIFPEIFSGTVLPNFSYRGISHEKATHFYPYIDFISQYHKELLKCNKDLVDEELLKHHQIIAIDINNDNRKLVSYSIYQCLYCELNYDSHLYMFEAGVWYLVDDEFNESIDLRIQPLLMHPWDCGIEYFNFSIRSEAKKRNVSNEYIFNEELVSYLNQSNISELLDTKLVAYQKSKIEICDVIYKENDKQIKLIHNKYKYGSSALSHLFSQGYVSANLITEKDFRKTANQKIKSDILKFPETDSILRSNYCIVYGIISKRNRKGKFSLPLFSKINLDIAKQNLERLGFSVELCFIEDKNEKKLM